MGGDGKGKEGEATKGKRGGKEGREGGEGDGLAHQFVENLETLHVECKVSRSVQFLFWIWHSRKSNLTTDIKSRIT